MILKMYDISSLWHALAWLPFSQPHSCWGLHRVVGDIWAGPYSWGRFCLLEGRGEGPSKTRASPGRGMEGQRGTRAEDEAGQPCWDQPVKMLAHQAKPMSEMCTWFCQTTEGQKAREYYRKCSPHLFHTVTLHLLLYKIRTKPYFIELFYGSK